MDLRKKILLKNLEYSLKYHMKNNNDVIDNILDDLDFCCNKGKIRYNLNKLYKYENENENIKDMLIQIKLKK
jgi:hypothetical protein